jgi:hypothetical protein
MRHLAGKRLTTHKKKRKEESHEPFCHVLAHDGVGRGECASRCEHSVKTKRELHLRLLLAVLSVAHAAPAPATAIGCPARLKAVFLGAGWIATGSAVQNQGGVMTLKLRMV